MSRSYSHPLSLPSITHIHNEYKNKLISFLFPIVHNKGCVLCRWNVDSSPSRRKPFLYIQSFVKNDAKKLNGTKHRSKIGHNKCVIAEVQEG